MRLERARRRLGRRLERQRQGCERPRRQGGEGTGQGDQGRSRRDDDDQCRRRGKHVTLEWGLIDALQGGESQAEVVLHRYVTTSTVKSHPAVVHIKMSTIYNPSLVHFVLYGPDGSFLSSSDTPDFGGQ
jgi:hypothetical protein